MSKSHCRAFKPLHSALCPALSDQSRKSGCDCCSANIVLTMPRFHLNTNRAAEVTFLGLLCLGFGVLTTWHTVSTVGNTHTSTVFFETESYKCFSQWITHLAGLTLRFGQIELPKNTMAVFIRGCCKEVVLTHSCPRFIYGPDNTYSFPDRLTQPDGCAKTSQKNQECKMSLVNLLNCSRTPCPAALIVVTQWV